MIYFVMDSLQGQNQRSILTIHKTNEEEMFVYRD